MYTYRTQLRAIHLEDELVGVEETLGVVDAGQTRRDERATWPRDIDPKETTVKLHSVTPQIIFMKATCEWIRHYAGFLDGLTQDLVDEKALKFKANDFRIIHQTIRYSRSWVEGMANSFTILEERANLQLNVLFNVISQQKNFLNRRETRLNTSIARSARQDSIPMTTFTFITALFLPGTFVARLFGMSMFDWLSEAGTNSNGVVSRSFWVYWVIAVPLTVLVMVGWYLWFRYANDKFRENMHKAHLEPATSAPCQGDEEPS